MTRHKDKPMTNYNETRKASSYVTDKFRKALENLAYDYEDEIVSKSLMEYYELCSKPDKFDHADDWVEPDKDLLWAIDRVLQDFMPYSDYREWVKERGYPKR